MLEPKVTLSLNLNPEVHKSLVTEAHRREISLTQLLREIIADWQLNNVSTTKKEEESGYETSYMGSR